MTPRRIEYITVEPTYDGHLFKLVSEQTEDLPALFSTYGIAVSVGLAEKWNDQEDNEEDEEDGIGGTRLKAGFIYSFPMSITLQFLLLSQGRSEELEVDMIYVDESLPGITIQLPHPDLRRIESFHELVDVRFVEAHPVQLSISFEHESLYERAAHLFIGSRAEFEAGELYFLQVALNLDNLGFMNSHQIDLLHGAFQAERDRTSDAVEKGWLGIVMRLIFLVGEPVEPDKLMSIFEMLLDEELPQDMAMRAMEVVLTRWSCSESCARHMETRLFFRLIAMVAVMADDGVINWSQLGDYMEALLDHLLRKTIDDDDGEEVEVVVTDENFEEFKAGFIDASLGRSNAIKIADVAYKLGYAKADELILPTYYNQLHKLMLHAARNLFIFHDNALGYFRGSFMVFLRLAMEHWPFLFTEHNIVDFWSSRFDKIADQDDLDSIQLRMLQLVPLLHLLRSRTIWKDSRKLAAIFNKIQRSILLDLTDYHEEILAALEATLQLGKYDRSKSKVIDFHLGSLLNSWAAQTGHHGANRVLFLAEHNLPRLFRIALSSTELWSNHCTVSSWYATFAKLCPHCFMQALAILKPSKKLLSMNVRPILLVHACLRTGEKACSRAEGRVCREKRRDLNSLAILDAYVHWTKCPDEPFIRPEASSKIQSNQQQNLAIQTYLLLAHGLGMDETSMLGLEGEFWDGQEYCQVVNYFLDRHKAIGEPN